MKNKWLYTFTQKNIYMQEKDDAEKDDWDCEENAGARVKSSCVGIYTLSPCNKASLLLIYDKSATK